MDGTRDSSITGLDMGFPYNLHKVVHGIAHVIMHPDPYKVKASRMALFGPVKSHN